MAEIHAAPSHGLAYLLSLAVVKAARCVKDVTPEHMANTCACAAAVPSVFSVDSHPCIAESTAAGALCTCWRTYAAGHEERRGRAGVKRRVCRNLQAER